jgi:hypothetical protein
MEDVSQTVCKKWVQACLLHFCLIEKGAKCCCWLGFLQFIEKHAILLLRSITAVAITPDLRMLSAWGGGAEHALDGVFLVMVNLKAEEATSSGTLLYGVLRRPGRLVPQRQQGCCI